MDLRDRLKEAAKVTDSVDDWKEYRKVKNECTMRQRKDKHESRKSMYEKIENEKDVRKLFSLTKEILNWNSSGPPSCFQKDGKLYRKQEDIANMQAEFYREKSKGY